MGANVEKLAAGIIGAAVRRVGAAVTGAWIDGPCVIIPGVGLTVSTTDDTVGIRLTGLAVGAVLVGAVVVITGFKEGCWLGSILGAELGVTAWNGLALELVVLGAPVTLTLDVDDVGERVVGAGVTGKTVTAPGVTGGDMIGTFASITGVPLIVAGVVSSGRVGVIGAGVTKTSDALE